MSAASLRRTGEYWCSAAKISAIELYMIAVQGAWLAFPEMIQVLSHHPTMPGVSKTAQAVIATRCLW